MKDLICDYKICPTQYYVIVLLSSGERISWPQKNLKTFANIYCSLLDLSISLA